MQINENNYATMLFISKQVSLPKISLILQKIKISPKRHILPFCTKPFNLFVDLPQHNCKIQNALYTQYPRMITIIMQYFFQILQGSREGMC